MAKTKIPIGSEICLLCQEAGRDPLPPAYYVGVIWYNKSRPAGLWAICQDHVQLAIKNFGRQCFGTCYWPVVCDMEMKVLYNSFEASLEGESMGSGWLTYLATVKNNGLNK